MSSSPVSIQDGLFTTNALASRKFLLVYILIIWSSILPVLIEVFLFWALTKENIIFIYCLFPINICIGYLTLIISSTLFSKLALFITNLFHKPNQGVFKMAKIDKDYYFWSLRATIKKWPIWIGNLIPSPLIHNFILKLFGIKTDYSNNISRGKIDTEFIELGSNVIIGQGCSIKSSMIVKGHLIINKILIGDNVVIGSNSFIAPGTHIGSNTILGTMSVTKINQKLEPNMIYSGNPVEKLQNNIMDQIQIYKEKEFQNYSNNFNNPILRNTNIHKINEKKFVKNLPLNIFTFGIIYFLANLVPVLSLFYYFYEYFFPFYIQKPTIIHVFVDIRSSLIFLITPFLLIVVLLINLFTVILISKILYKIFQFKNPAKEGIFHWNDKNPDFNNYFKRSFILRYAKWKIQKSPFPWLIKPAFNLIGNCQFGKNTVIEDCFIGKEFLKIGSNSYLGKALLANHLWDRNLTIKRIIIGDNVEISDNCCIAPGTVIDNNVTVLPLSVTSKYGKLSFNSVYYHSPSKKIEDLDSNYRFIHKIGDNHVK